MKHIAITAALLLATQAPAVAQPTDADVTSPDELDHDHELDHDPQERVVRGTVRDAATHQPIPGVSVYLAETGAVSITDEAGAFELAGPDGPWQLIAVDPSYRKTTVAVPAGRDLLPLEVRLTPLNLRGEEVLVEVERQRQAAGETMLRREEIMRVPGSHGDMLQAVKSLPGIAQSQGQGPSAGLIIRGSSPADSRIFVDGWEIPILYHFGGIQSVIPSEMIDELVYQPGGFGVEYGKASSGIIDVKTRSGAKTTSGFGEVSFINTAALAQGPIGENGNFTLSARRSYIDAVIPLVVSEEDLSFTTLPVYYDYQARAEWKATPHLTLSTFFFGSDDRLELATSEVDPEDPEGKASGRFFNQNRFTYLITAADFERGPVRNHLSVIAGTQLESFEIGSDRYLRLEQQQLGARDELRVRVGDRVALLGGGEVKQRWFDNRVKIPRPPQEGDPNEPNLGEDPLIISETEYPTTDSAGWAAVEVSPARWLKTTAGARADWFGRNEAFVLQPRLQARSQVSRGTALLGAVGLYSRPPDDNDENLQTTNLGPERSTQYSLGVEQKLPGGVEVTTTGFYLDRSDLIVFAAGDRTTAQEGDGTSTYTNEGVGRTYGGEALVSLRNERFFGWLAYTLSRSERRDHPMDSTRLFDHDQTHNVVLVGSYKLGAWQLGGRFQYATGTPYTPVTGATYMSDANTYEPSYGATNSVRNAAHHQLDVRVDRAFEFEHWKLSAYLDVANVYMNAPVIDRRYSYDYSEREDVEGIPILPSLGVRGEF